MIKTDRFFLIFIMSMILLSAGYSSRIPFQVAGWLVFGYALEELLRLFR